MTRGTFYIVTDKIIIESIEFNGDMYPDKRKCDGVNGLCQECFALNAKGVKE